MLGQLASGRIAEAGQTLFPSLKRTRERLRTLLDAAPCSRADIERWQTEGEALDDAAIEAICLRAAGPDGTGAVTTHADFESVAQAI